MPVSNSEIGVTELKIFVNNLVSRATIVIEKLPEKPSSLDEPTQTVFRYIEIKKVVLTEENIEKATIKFKIEKKWLIDNNLDVNSVSLLRYTTKWVKLSTKRLSEDNDFIYFESETPGFSYFAIAADKAVVEEQKVVEPVAEVIEPKEEIIAEEKTETEVIKEPQKETKEKRPLWLLFFIVLVFGLAVLLLYIKGKRRHESENLEKHKSSVHSHSTHVHSGHGHAHEHVHQEDHSYDKIEEELNQLRKR